jgi:hypothetical protein
MRVTRFLIGSVALAAALLAFAPTRAAAQDIKVFPGAFCQAREFSSIPPESDESYSYGQGGFDAEIPGWDIVCPIVRDAATNTTGFKLTAWTFDFWDSEATSCTAFITRTNTSGTLELDFATRSSGVAFTGFTRLDWGTSLNAGAADAVYYMNCNVPTYHRLNSYRVEEP